MIDEECYNIIKALYIFNNKYGIYANSDFCVACGKRKRMAYYELCRKCMAKINLGKKFIEYYGIMLYNPSNFTEYKKLLMLYKLGT